MRPSVSQGSGTTDIVPYVPTTLPARLDGFLKTLAAISDGKYTQGGLTIDFPTSFDRDNLEMIWYSGDSRRSGGFFLNLLMFRESPLFWVWHWDILPITATHYGKSSRRNCWKSSKVNLAPPHLRFGSMMGAGMPRYRLGLILVSKSNGWSYSGVLIEYGDYFEK
jgi:hypothetical protein